MIKRLHNQPLLMPSSGKIGQSDLYCIDLFLFLSIVIDSNLTRALGQGGGSDSEKSDNYNK